MKNVTYLFKNLMHVCVGMLEFSLVNKVFFISHLNCPCLYLLVVVLSKKDIPHKCKREKEDVMVEAVLFLQSCQKTGSR